MNALDTRPLILVHDRDGNLLERATSLDDWLGDLPVHENARNPMTPAGVTVSAWEHRGQLFVNFPTMEQVSNWYGPPLPNHAGPPWPLARSLDEEQPEHYDAEADALAALVHEPVTYGVQGLPEYPEMRK